MKERIARSKIKRNREDARVPSGIQCKVTKKLPIIIISFDSTALRYVLFNKI